MRIRNQSGIDLNSPCNAALHALFVLGMSIELGKFLYDDYNVAPLAYYDVALCYSNILQMYHCLCTVKMRVLPITRLCVHRRF